MLLFSTACASSLESPLHGQGTDGPPAAVEATGGLLDGVALCVGGAGVTVVQKHLAQVQHRGHAGAVLLNVALQLLEETRPLNQGNWG